MVRSCIPQQRTTFTKGNKKMKTTSNQQQQYQNTTNTTYLRTPLYTPKIRQMAVSNKLLNEQLYSLYTVTKMNITGALLKSSILDGTIKVNNVVYIVSWLDTLPIDAYKESTLCISLRTPKYRDSRTGEYPHSYAVVSKVSN